MTHFPTESFTPSALTLCWVPGFMLWIEYLRIHRTINRYKMLIGGILLPIALSGTIELLQAYCTEHRGGDWLDFAANTLGVLLSALVRYYILRPLMWKKT